MSLPWLRLYTEFASDPKIQILAFEDQRHFVMLLCLKGNGVLDADSPNDAYRERLIAKALGLDPASGMEGKRRLIEAGLINSDWQPLKWGQRQMVSDSSTERVRKFREKHEGNVSETLPKRRSNDIDKNRRDKTREDQNKTCVEPKPSTSVETIFSHWAQTHGHQRAKLDAKRRKLIIAALNSYPEADLCQAITGYLNSPHHMGQNDSGTRYDDIEIFLRDAKHIDMGLKFHADPPRTDLSEKSRRIIGQTETWVPPEVRNATR